MQEFLNRVYFGNTVMMYLTAAGIFLAGIIIILIFKNIVLKQFKKWAEKTETTIDDFIVRGIERTVVPLLYYWAFYIGLHSLTLNEKISQAMGIISICLITFFVIKLIASVVRYTLSTYLYRKGEEQNKEKQLRGVMTIIHIFIWGVGVVFLLDNMGFQISAVIAGLGIGGIAIALAAQTILGDLFSYFVIFFDRPFEIGDAINIRDKSGSVEYIGLKTTRLRSIGGEQLIISNTELVNSQVHNYKRMERRRIEFKFNVVYQTPAEKVAEIPNLIKKIITGIPDTDFERAHFFAYGDFSLVYVVVYFVQTSDYNRYMDIQQEINLNMYTEFETQGIQFAYPTQTLYINKTGFPEVSKTDVDK